MLEEIAGVRQDNPELRRRWFHDDYFDLFIVSKLREYGKQLPRRGKRTN